MPIALIAPGSQSVYQILYNLATASLGLRGDPKLLSGDENAALHRLVQNTVRRLSKPRTQIEPKPRKLAAVAEAERIFMSKGEERRFESQQAVRNARDDATLVINTLEDLS